MKKLSPRITGKMGYWNNGAGFDTKKEALIHAAALRTIARAGGTPLDALMVEKHLAAAMREYAYLVKLNK